jgi:hypothetical protein
MEILVEAVLDGGCISDAGDEPYRFRKGDIGILRWHGASYSMSCWEPYVVWDSDPSKFERRILFEHLAAIGLDKGGSRVFLL